MKCAICDNLASSKITWGGSQIQTRCLCDKCTQELWDKAKGGVSMGVFIWSQEKI